MQPETYSDESFDNQPTELDTPTVQMPGRQGRTEDPVVPAQQENGGDLQYPQRSQYPPYQQYSQYPPQPQDGLSPQQEAAYRAQQREAAYRAQRNVQRAAAGEERAYTTAFAIAKLIDYLGWVLLVLEVALSLRFLLKLIGANPANPFTSFLYNLTNVFLFIFNDIVTNPTFGPGRADVFEVTTLIAMIVYGLIYLLLKLLLRTTISRPNEPVV
jgi:YGGT family